MTLPEQIADLAAAAGYGPGDPLVVGVQRAGAPPVFSASGRAATAEPLTGDTIVYTASLAKQVTAACAALLVRQGRLDVESPVTRWLPELPAYAAPVRLRHLIAHTSGLPDVPGFDDLHRAGLDRTTARVVDALRSEDRLVSAPGTEHRYSNAGYVCLAVVVERAADRALPDLAAEDVFTPLGMGRSRFWSGPAAHPAGAAPLDPAYPAPLSLGDGGLWSSATDLLRWNLALDRDELGVSALLQSPGHLDDGTLLDYAWGVGVREQAGRRIYRHGGRWAGLSAQLVRIAATGSSLVVLALDDDEERAQALADGLITALAP